RSDEERERERRGRRSERPSRFSGGGGDRDRSPRNKKRGARIFVSNIPYEFRWQELKDLFREQVGEVSFVELFVDENDKPRGCGVIEFANPELAKEAVDKMHRYDIKGRKLVVKEDSDVDRDKYGRIAPRGEGRGGNMGGRNRADDQRGVVNGPGAPPNASKWGNTYGLSIQFLESLNINGPLVPRCFVANLDYKVDEKKLREVFRLAGRVISAEISMDKEGKSRGFGVVEYEHPVEAVQAISMFNNQLLFDRRLSVRMDRVGDKGDGLPAKLPEGLKSIGMGLGANGVPLQDVAREYFALLFSSGNLPNAQNNTQSGVNIGAVSNPALTAAALVSSLMGAPGPADLSTLNSPFGVGAGALANTNTLAAQLLNNTTGRAGGLNAFASNAGGRDFDSLSAALSAGGGFNQGGGGGGGLADRSRTLGAGAGTGANTSRPSSDTIIVKNLPPGTTWQVLRDKCRDAGDVKFAEMRGKDTGVVQFASQWDAQRAVSILSKIP
ncbi:hypothetical protein AAG570_006558, partial [Ranatra chinensis]